LSGSQAHCHLTGSGPDRSHTEAQHGGNIAALHGAMGRAGNIEADCAGVQNVEV